MHGRDELAQLTATFNETAAALEQSVSELRALEAMSRRFVADVSHELRTPLAAMTAVTDVLEEEAERLPEDMGQAVRLVLQEIDRLRALVDAPHRGEPVRRRAPRRSAGSTVDVGDAIAECLEVRGWTSRHHRRRAARADLLPRPPPVRRHHGEPRRQRAAARRAAGGRHAYGAAADGLEVNVRDHGEGIPAEAMPHVFDRFYKAEAGRTRSEGSGLGLAIAKANAELHGGTSRRGERRPRRPVHPLDPGPVR